MVQYVYGPEELTSSITRNGKRWRYTYHTFSGKRDAEAYRDRMNKASKTWIHTVVPFDLQGYKNKKVYIYHWYAIYEREK